MRLLRRTAVCVAAVTMAMLAMGAGNAFGAQVKVCKLLNPARSTRSARRRSRSRSPRTTRGYGPVTIKIRPNECALAYVGWYSAQPARADADRGADARDRHRADHRPVGGAEHQRVGALGTPHKSCCTSSSAGRSASPWVDYDVYQAVGVATFTNRYGYY